MTSKRGPKPTPSGELAKRGSWRARTRELQGEPQLEVCPQPAPDWLTESARPYWPDIAEMLADMGVLTKADRGALALLCDALAVYVRARLQVEREDLTIVNVQGNVVVNPAVKIMQAAWTQVLKACQEFGLTPSARTGVRVAEPKQAPDGPSRDDFFKERSG